MNALWISSDVFKQPGTGGDSYTRSVLEVFRKSSAISLTREIAVKQPRPTIGLKGVGWLRSLVTGKSTLRITYTSRELLDLLADPSTFSDIDAVIFNGEDQLGAAELVPRRIPVFYVVHNLEREYAKLLIDGLPLWQRLMFAVNAEADKRVREEARALDRASLVVGISVAELEIASRRHSIASCWLPPTFGPQIVREPRAPTAGVTVGMLGGLGHFPNRAAVDFFLREVWPHADEHARLTLAGKGTEAFTDPGRRILGLGLLDDVNDFWRSIDVLAAPIMHGAGTNVKICEALWHRVPMLVSPLALRGLPIIHDGAVRVLTSAEEWKFAVRGDQLVKLASMRPGEETARWFDQRSLVERLNQTLTTFRETTAQHCKFPND